MLTRHTIEANVIHMMTDTEETMTDGVQISDDHAARFYTAGRATFTVRNPETDGRFTFKVTKGKADDAPHFVKVLTGPQNTADFSYLGCIFADGRFVVTRKSRISKDAPSAKAFAWVHGRLAAGRDLAGVEFWHEGSCCRCGRALTVPSSVASGIGPICAQR